MTFAAPLAELLESAPLAPLGPGSVTEALAQWRREGTRLPSGTPTDLAAAELCIAGILLMHNDLDGSHRISQRHEDATGSYWHGIMHRREPDAENSKYWFRRVGQHPTFAAVLEAATREMESAGLDLVSGPLAWLTKATVWDPFRFVDSCERLRDTASPEEEFAQRIQRAECRALFDFTYRKAYGP